jgi:ABC-2 type transport system permease protein
MKASPTVAPVDQEPVKAARTARSPRGGFRLAALGALYVLTLRQHLHGKRWMVLGALFLTPALLAGVVRLTAPETQPTFSEFWLVFMFIPQALLPLVALLYASGIIQDEQEEQTFTYILVRPIPKWAIYVIKVLATLTTTVVLTAVFTTLTYAVIYIGTGIAWDSVAFRCVKAVGIHGLTVAAYSCLFGVMSLLTRWTLVVGFLYTAFFEAFLANLPFSIRLATILYYSRLIAYRSMDFVIASSQGNRNEDLAARWWRLDTQTDPQLLEHPALGTCLAVLLIASLLCTLLGAILCARREFHVKTPEGS